MLWDLNQVKDMCISFHYSHLMHPESIYGSYYELLTTMCAEFLQKTNWVLSMVKWSFEHQSSYPLSRNIICSSSTNHFIIGTIHKHQNFKKLTQQATTKQSLAKLIKNYKLYKTKRNISHNPYLKLALPTF